MRTFLALFPSIYLVDNIPFWTFYGIFFRWYDDSSSWDSFLIESVVSLAMAAFIRLLQKRPAILFGRWIQQPLADTETLRNILISVILLFPCLIGYRDIIELSGSPNPSQHFPLGRIRTMVMINIVLVMIYAFEMQWRDLLGPQSSLHQRDAKGRVISPKGTSFLRSNRLQPQWLLYLGAILNGAILLDMFIVQALALTYPLLLLMLGCIALFVTFNMCWNNSLPHELNTGNNNKES